MPQNTPNLVLTCYDLTTDAGVYFSTFRSTLAGYTNSALTKIDTWAGTVNADLTALKQAPAIVRVSAIKADDFLYNATVVGLAQYTTGMYINLSLDVTNLGTVSLNINSLGGRSLLKVDSTGAFVNITQNDLRLNKNNLFTYNGTAWIWINAVSSDQLNVIGTALNLTRISATNTLEDAGVSFAPTVVNNGIPQRTATGQLKSVEAVANDDVVNKLYADTIDSKIGILSALTTIDKTSVVGAINENSSAIGQISNPNLLINGDFQIWQRGASFTNLYQQYSADRWYSTVSANNFKTEKASNGMKVTLLSGTNQTFYLSQKIEQTLIDFLNGKKGILSMSVDGIVSQSTFTGSGQQLGTLWTKLFITTGESHIINWVKVELGEIATPFSPRPYAEELAMCKRYYRQEPIMSSCQRSTLQYDSVITHNNPMPMRIDPTIKFFNVDGTIENIVSDQNSNDVVGTFIIAHNTIYGFCISYRDATTKVLPTNAVHCLVKMDAEIY